MILKVHLEMGDSQLNTFLNHINKSCTFYINQDLFYSSPPRTIFSPY
ncbi:Uncharacterised protein [Streptococcus pneumoniae]|nr:Uncharacterised protein [Streptococcus pneumoniae]